MLHPSLSGCLKELSILTPQMQLKKWLSQNTLFIKAAALTRSLGKPSVTPTQAKKLVTEGFDYQSLSLLHRTSRTEDDFHEGLKKRGFRSKPLGAEAVQGSQFPLSLLPQLFAAFSIRCYRVLFTFF